MILSAVSLLVTIPGLATELNFRFGELSILMIKK